MAKRKDIEADQLLPRGVTGVVKGLLIIMVAVPVLYMALLAFSPNSTVALGGAGLGHLTSVYFVDMWTTAPLLR